MEKEEGRFRRASSITEGCETEESLACLRDKQSSEGIGTREPAKPGEWREAGIVWAHVESALPAV